MNKLLNIIKNISIVLLILLLSNCARIRHKDGPPNFYVDESRIPNAVPRIEPLSKCGNMRSYCVFGRRYYVMRSSRHYVAVGIASWYGTSFHSRRTSSGERYNMLSMTAAHKTLPLPTYVEVTNLQNHRKIIVKVNDRGPFTANRHRLIDLSYVAAKKLRIIGHGTAWVRIKAIDLYQPHHRYHAHARRRTAHKRHHGVRYRSWSRSKASHHHARHRTAARHKRIHRRGY